MKTIYLDCGMGAAGDMLTAALLELLPEPDNFLEELEFLKKYGVEITKETVSKCGINGTHISVKICGAEESEDMHGHHHGHGHSHAHDGSGHFHSSLHDIEHIVSHFPVTDKIKQDILAVYHLIADAESHAHGVPVEQIHFHEVGTMDAVADVTAVCMLLDKLAPDQLVASSVHVGSGQVKCAHGILPVPAPATAYILRDVPVYGGEIRGELCTPTGAALLKHFVTEFGSMPLMRISRIGYGMGKKDFDTANCVRAMLDETVDEAGDTVAELSCNVDDMTAEAIGFVIEILLESGALEVFTVPVGMKKSRPGTLLVVLCKNADRKEMTELIFKHTTTIGIRENTSKRYTLERIVENVPTPYGNIRKKISSGYGVRKEKYEYEDLSRIAKENGISIAEVDRLLAVQYNVIENN